MNKKNDIGTLHGRLIMFERIQAFYSVVKNINWLLIALVLFMVSTSACTVSTPAAVTKKFNNELYQGNCENIINYVPVIVITATGGESAVISACQDTYDQYKQSGHEVKSFKIIETVVDGDDAMVIYKILWKDGNETIKTAMLVREENQWKVLKIIG